MKKPPIIFDAEFTDISSEGFGVCRAPDGRSCFVAGALSGERARVKIIKEYKNYCIGRAEELYCSSPDRIESDCAVFRRCGGCAFRHLDYKAELEIKRRGVESALRRIGGVDMTVETPLSARPEEYRNKLLLPLSEKDGRVFCGFFAKHSHSVVECPDCKLHTADFAAIAQKLTALIGGNSVYNEEKHKGLLRHIFLRRNKKGEFCAAVIVNGTALPKAASVAEALMAEFPQVISFFVNINTKRGNTVLGSEWKLIKGEPYLEETLCGKRFLLSPASFFQVNPEATELLYGTAAAMADIKEGETVFDLYCGVGSVGLCLCPDSAKLCGVEIVPQAVENAKKNAALNGVENAHFICGDATEGFSACKTVFGKSADTVLVDPPRAGLTPDLIKQIAEAAPSKLVYISCNAATLARDIKLFAAQGYTVKQLKAVDMFPRTAHCETVALLSRQKYENEYEEYFMNRTVEDIMIEYGEQRDEWKVCRPKQITDETVVF